MYVIGWIKDNGWVIWVFICFSNNIINFVIDVFFFLLLSYINWFGIDSIGGDVLVKIIYGFCILLLFGLILILFFSVIGICVGVV